MKKKIVTTIVIMLLSSSLVTVRAQIPILDIIKEGITAVIVAVDLKIQRLQNETIWLQNAQKTLENEMSRLKLQEIGDWVEKQRQLYDDYFNELWQVKAVLANYHRVREIIAMQVRLVKEYQAVWPLLQQDKNFTVAELDHMYTVYRGIMEESLKNVDQLFVVVNAFVTQMPDAKRLEIIDAVSAKVEENLNDLEEFTTQNKLISLQRAAERGEIERARKLYGF